jgi:hypothetical protein
MRYKKPIGHTTDFGYETDSSALSTPHHSSSPCAKGIYITSGKKTHNEVREEPTHQRIVNNKDMRPKVIQCVSVLQPTRQNCMTCKDVGFSVNLTGAYTSQKGGSEW